MDEPIFQVWTRDGVVRTAGSPTCALGRRVPRASADSAVRGGAEGVFAEWCWDGTTLRVRSDRYGLVPLYYFARPDGVAVSPSILRLVGAGAPTELNEAALAVFLRLGFFLGEDTPFRAIRSVPPDATFEWTEGRLRVGGQRVIRPPHRYDRAQAVDAFIDLFRVAIRRLAPGAGDFAVPLSGGRDSRHILLELCRRGHRPTFCFTVRYFPPIADREVAAAAGLARALRLRHIVLDQRRPQVETELRRNWKTGFCAREHEWFLAAADFLEGRVAVSYDGIAGDMLSGSDVTAGRLALFDAEDYAALAAHLVDDAHTEGALAAMLPASQYRRFGCALALDAIAVELEQHREAPNPIGSFYFWNRTRRTVATSPFRILDVVPTVYCPFLDSDLFDFLSSLPAADLIDGQLHTDTIARGYPEFAHLPYSSDDIRCDDWRHYRRVAWDVIRNPLLRGPTPLLRRSALLPRLLRCLAESRYSRSALWLSNLGLYLAHLGALAERGESMSWPELVPR